MTVGELLRRATEMLGKGARIAAALAAAPPAIRSAWDEAQVRVAAEIKAHQADPSRPIAFDGPGSPQHLFGVLKQVADERKIDLMRWWIENVGTPPKPSEPAAP